MYPTHNAIMNAIIKYSQYLTRYNTSLNMHQITEDDITAALDTTSQTTRYNDMTCK